MILFHEDGHYTLTPNGFPGEYDLLWLSRIPNSVFKYRSTGYQTRHTADNLIRGNEPIGQGIRSDVVSFGI